jgi:multiple sugar transport system substrate-binding protein
MRRAAGIASTFAAFTLAAALGACGIGEGAEVREVRFWAFGREGEVVQQLVPEFERRYPGVRVRVQQIPWSAAHEKLLTAFVGDATPDVALLGNTWVPEFTALGALAPLDARVAGSRDVEQRDYFPGIWDTNVIDGVTYGVPWYVDTRVLFYRTDLLARAGYKEVPATWSEWKDAMERVKRLGGSTKYAILLPTNEWPPPTVFALQNGADLLRDGGRYGDFRDPRFRAAYDFYLGLFRDSLAPPIANTAIANLYQEFARGTFAMYITGPWNVGEFKARIPADRQGDWGTAPMPAPDGQAAPGASLAGGASLVLFRSSRRATDAWHLIEFLSTPAVQRRFYQLTGDLPPRRAAWSDSLRSDRYTHAFWTQLQQVRATPKVPEWEAIATRLQDCTEEIVRGRSTVDAALASLDHDVDALLEKRRWLLAHGETTGGRRSPSGSSPGSIP